MDDMLLLTEVRPLGGDPAATDIFEVLDNKDQQYLGLRMADNFNDQKRLNHLGKALEWGQQFICERLTASLVASRYQGYHPATGVYVLAEDIPGALPLVTYMSTARDAKMLFAEKDFRRMRRRARELLAGLDSLFRALLKARCIPCDVHEKNILVIPSTSQHQASELLYFGCGRAIRVVDISQSAHYQTDCRTELAAGILAPAPEQLLPVDHGVKVQSKQPHAQPPCVEVSMKTVAWQLMRILLVMLSGKDFTSAEGRDASGLYDRILNHYKIPNNLLAELLSQVLLDDPALRPGFSRVLGHVGLRQGNQAEFIKLVNGFITDMGSLLEKRGPDHNELLALLNKVVRPVLVKRGGEGLPNYMDKAGHMRRVMEYLDPFLGRTLVRKGDGYDFADVLDAFVAIYILLKHYQHGKQDKARFLHVCGVVADEQKETLIMLLVSPDMTGPVITAYYAAACQSSSPTLLQHVTCDLDAAAGATNKPASSLMLGSSDICSWQTWRVVDLAISSITESQEISTGAHDRRQSSASFTSGITTPEIGRAGSAGAAASCGGQGQDEQQQQPAEAQEQGDIRQGSQQQSGSDGTPGAVGGNRASDSEHCNQGAGQELEGEVISTTATEGKLGCLKSVQLGRPLHVSLRDPMIQQLWRDAKHNVRQDVAVVLTGFDWLNSTPTDMGFYMDQIKSLWHDAGIMRMYGPSVVVLTCTCTKILLLEASPWSFIRPAMQHILAFYPNLRVPASSTTGKLTEQQMVELVVHACMFLISGSKKERDVQRSHDLLASVLADEPGLQHVPALLVLREMLSAVVEEDQERVLSLMANSGEGLLHLWAQHCVPWLRSDVVKGLCSSNAKVTLRDLNRKLGTVYVRGHGDLPSTNLGRFHEVLVPRSVGEEVDESAAAKVCIGFLHTHWRELLPAGLQVKSAGDGDVEDGELDEDDLERPKKRRHVEVQGVDLDLMIEFKPIGTR